MSSRCARRCLSARLGVASTEMAEFLGLMAADGYVHRDGTEHLLHQQRPACCACARRVLWSRLFMGSSASGPARPGWNEAASVEKVNLTGSRDRRAVAARAALHRRPPSSRSRRSSSTRTRRSRKRSCAATTPATASSGATATRSRRTAPCSHRASAGCTTSPASPPRCTSSSAARQTYYQLNLASAVRVGAKGQHLRKNPAEVRRVVPASVPDDEWTFDVETESGEVLRRRRPPGDLQLPPPRPGVRHPQDHLARGRDQARPREGAAPRQPRRRTRLGLREGLRGSDVADAPARHPRGLRDRDRRGPLGARVLRGRLRRGRPGRLRAVRDDRPGVRAPGGGRPPDRRPGKGRARPRLEAADELRGADPADDARRPRAARGRAERDGRCRCSTPRRRCAALREELRGAVARVLDSERYILGPEVSAFEQEFAAYCGAEHAIGVANGTEAITIALRAMGVGPGDEVVVPSFTFYASAEAIPPTGRDGRCSATSTPTPTASPPRPCAPR